MDLNAVRIRSTGTVQAHVVCRSDVDTAYMFLRKHLKNMISGKTIVEQPNRFSVQEAQHGLINMYLGKWHFIIENQKIRC